MINTRKKQTEFFELSKLRRRFVLIMILSLFFALFSRAIYLQGMQKAETQALQRRGAERNDCCFVKRYPVINAQATDSTTLGEQ